MSFNLLEEDVMDSPPVNWRTSMRYSWDTWAKQVVADHVSALSWRTRLLEACEPAVAFLAVVLQFGKTRANEMPLVAVESVLQSHPHMEAVMEIVQEAPASVQRLLATTK